MPTKKRRVGFIPRSDVLDLINELSFENNLSYSKIINILVEEALFKRGMLKMKTSNIYNLNHNGDSHGINKGNQANINKEFTYNFKNNLLKGENLNTEHLKDEHLDKEIYAKFIMFLQFQERMKKGF